jgi:hypothetical protein
MLSSELVAQLRLSQNRPHHASAAVPLLLSSLRTGFRCFLLCKIIFSRRFSSSIAAFRKPRQIPILFRSRIYQFKVPFLSEPDQHRPHLRRPKLDVSRLGIILVGITLEGKSSCPLPSTFASNCLISSPSLTVGWPYQLLSALLTSSYSKMGKRCPMVLGTKRISRML